MDSLFQASNWYPQPQKKKLFLIPGQPKFAFVRAVEKKIVEVKNNDELTGEILKHLCGPRDRPIYIRPVRYDFSRLL